MSGFPISAGSGHWRTWDSGDFFLQDGAWYVEAKGNEYRVSDQVEIHLSDADMWLSGADGLASVLADGYELTPLLRPRPRIREARSGSSWRNKSGRGAFRPTDTDPARTQTAAASLGSGDAAAVAVTAPSDCAGEENSQGHAPAWPWLFVAFAVCHLSGFSAGRVPALRLGRFQRSDAGRGPGWPPGWTRSPRRPAPPSQRSARPRWGPPGRRRCPAAQTAPPRRPPGPASAWGHRSSSR